ncbi:MAG: hypothetical protein AB9861_18580 [Methanosarcina sp.]|jgi:hypothetical protein
MKEEVAGVFGKFGLESAHKYQYITSVINTFLIYLVLAAACPI